METTLLFATHKLTSDVIAKFAAVLTPPCWEKVVFFDSTKSSPDSPMVDLVLAAGMRFESFTFKSHVLSKGYFPISNRLVPGNNHFPVIEYLLSSESIHVWQMEYDVDFTGNWRDFFTAHQTSEADLLTAKIRNKSFDPNWFWWRTLKSPYPVDQLQGLKSFNPIYRLSRTGAEALKKMYQDGWRGHHEATMATCLHHAGFAIEDFGGKGKFTRSINLDRWYSPTSHVWRRGAKKLGCFGNNLIVHPRKAGNLPQLEQSFIQPLIKSEVSQSMTILDVPPLNEKSLSVVMTVVERPQQVGWCLHHIRNVYPQIPITVIEDGSHRPEYEQICNHFGAQLVIGKRLKRATEGGQWWQRTLLAAKSMQTDFVFKIDPDTKFQRKVIAWPETDIAGSLHYRGSRHEQIQGGAQLLSRNCIERLLTSEIFLAPELFNPAVYTWDSGLLHAAIHRNYLCTDAMLQYAKKKLGLSWANWKEVSSAWKYLMKNSEFAAVTHPHKWKKYDLEILGIGTLNKQN